MQPANTEHKTCGTLKFSKMILLSVSPLIAPSRSSIGFKLEEPILKLITTSKIVIAQTAISAHHFLLESLL